MPSATPSPHPIAPTKTADAANTPTQLQTEKPKKQSKTKTTPKQGTVPTTPTPDEPPGQKQQSTGKKGSKK